MSVLFYNIPSFLFQDMVSRILVLVKHLLSMSFSVSLFQNIIINFDFLLNFLESLQILIRK